MPKVLIIAGPNGVGKTTRTRLTSGSYMIVMERQCSWTLERLDDD